MRPTLLLVLVALGAVPACLWAHTEPPLYVARFEGHNGQPFVQLSEQIVEGKTERLVTVRFTVRRTDGKPPDRGDRVVIREDDAVVAEVDLFQPNLLALSTVLCFDVSGSMAAAGKIEQARTASADFLDRLNAAVDLGLILFDDQVREEPTRFVPLAGEPASYAATRRKIRELIVAARPEGGTAYLDATARAVAMLGVGSKLSRKAVVVMTDGADLASQATLDGVIAQARAARVPVYTIGIGAAGSREVVDTVLVLDRSGSMKAKASDGDAQTKVAALHDAASRFIDLTRPNARTTLLPFSTTIPRPRAPTSDRAVLKQRIRDITAEGGTRLYDAILDGIETVAATATGGKRFVVVLTDGRDEAPGSRVGPAELIARAKEEKVVLHTLGLGREQEINTPVLEQLARETGGRFFHASNQRRLLAMFEELSLALYDDGIDEESLRKLAGETGGQYYHAREAARLGSLFPELARTLQETHTVTFASRRQLHDGTARGITLAVERASPGSAAGPEPLSNVAEAGYNVRGLVVVPFVDPLLFALLLTVLLALVALPTLLKRRSSPPG